MNFRFYFLAFITLLPLLSQGQVKEYFKFSIVGDSLLELGKIQDAKTAYIKALGYYNTEYSTNISLSSVYLKLKEKDKGEKYLKIAISQGISIEQLRNDTTINKHLKANPKLTAIYRELHQSYLSKIPFQQDRTTLLKLMERGQALRELLGILDFKKVDSLIHLEDLSAMKSFKAIVKRIGFPDMLKVGKDGADAAFIILMHTLNSGVDEEENNQLILPLIKKSVLEGNFSSFYYAILVDRHKGLKRENQIYGTYWENVKGKKVVTPINEIENIDKRRIEIGLPTLRYSSEIENLELPKEYTPIHK